MTDSAPIRAPDKLKPTPRDNANTLGGGIDAADLPPPAQNLPARSSDHAASGWRTIPASKP